MIDLEKIRAIVISERKALEKEKQKLERKLERARQREVEKINVKYEKEKEKQLEPFDENISAKQQESTRRIAGQVYHELRGDYQTLQQRSALTDITEEDLAKAKQIKAIQQTADIIEDPAARQTMLSTIPLLANNERVRAAVDQMVEGRFTKSGITSYILTERGKAHIVIPVEEKENKQLAESLEERIFNTVCKDKFYDEKSTPEYNHKSREAILDSISQVEIADTDIGETKGFRTYTLSTRIGGESNKLARFLSEQLEKLQPEGFDKTNLVHKVQILEDTGDVLKYLQEHGIEELYTPIDELHKLIEQGKTSVSYDQAVEISHRHKTTLYRAVKSGRIEESEGKLTIPSLIGYLENPKRTTAVRQTTPYSKENVERSRQEAYKRLDDLGKTALDSSDIKHILGVRSNSYATGLAKNPDMTAHVTRKDGRLYFSADGIKKYIADREYKGNKWVKQ